MKDYHKQYPTWGDLAREQLRRRGIPYSGDVEDEARRRLERLPVEARKAFALACAERLMVGHERLPPSERLPSALAWRPVLDAMWSGLGGHDEEALRRVVAALDAYYASRHNHSDGQDGPQDAYDNAAAASIYAAECFRDGDVQWARWAASCAFEGAFRIADEELQLDLNDFVWDPTAEPMPLAKTEMHPAVQAELRRQLADLEVLEREGVTPSVLRRLRGRERDTIGY